jgi:hypothetical protein
MLTNQEIDNLIDTIPSMTDTELILKRQEIEDDDDLSDDDQDDILTEIEDELLDRTGVPVDEDEEEDEEEDDDLEDLEFADDEDEEE